MSVGAYFFFRRCMSKRTAHADSPPATPLIGKFDAGRLSAPKSPVPIYTEHGMSEKGFSEQGLGQTQWAERGNGTYGPEWPLSPLPLAYAQDQGLERNPSVGSQRETMRVFPNGREKLGGKEFPSNF